MKTSPRLDSTFYFGSHLCREPMPPLPELKHDMELLKRQGFNLIKLQEHWMLDEPAESHYDFSRYEELIAHAATLDLSVYLGLTCEQAPNWLWRKYPDCRMEGRDGLPIANQAQLTLPSDGKPGPCYDHPGAMAAQLRFITKLVQTLGRFENVVVWNTWQEIGYWAEGLVGRHVCYCPHTLAHYRRWLAEKYGDLDNLNRAWNTRYSEWVDVLPERTNRMQACVQDTAWRYFMDNVQIGHILKERAAAIRAADPLQRPIFAHKGGPDIGSGKDWSYARCQDFLGVSCYPAWSSPHWWDDGHTRPFAKHLALLSEMWDGMAFKFDYIRCANPPDKPVWAAEFQGGPVSTGFRFGRVPTPADIRRWMLTAVGSGVTAISFWVTRAEIAAAELNGFSLLDSAGDTTARLDEAGRVGRALCRHPDLFAAPTKARAAVAILVDEWSHQMRLALPESDPLARYSLRGWYRYLWDAGIDVDFVEVSELNEPYVANYKALIAPLPLVMAGTTAAKLAALTAAGVNLISEAFPGRVDENAFCVRGEMPAVLVSLFGAVPAGRTMVREPEGGQRWSVNEYTWGEFADASLLAGSGPLAGHQLRPHVYIQTFTPTTGTPILRHGTEIAGVCRQTGQGMAWLLGTIAGNGGTAYRHDPSRTCLLAILEQCGVAGDSAGQLLRRRRVAANREAWILTNPTPATVTENIAVSGFAAVTDLDGRTMPCVDGHISVTLDSLDVTVLILQKKS